MPWVETSHKKFDKEPKNVWERIAGTPDLIWMQFVPGEVVEVCSNMYQAPTANSAQNINSILAIAHFGENANKDPKSLGNEDRYFPLLRGLVDNPRKGEQVLLCSFGGRNYYLGPINTANNPNDNQDPLQKPQKRYFYSDKEKVQIDGKDPVSAQYNINAKLYRKVAAARLTKPPILGLDNPIFEDTEEAVENQEKANAAFFDRPDYEQSPDMLFEGRHGNSIRVGSRFDNSYIYFSNGQNPNSDYEQLLDGSTIALLEWGSIANHFPVRGSKLNQWHWNGFKLSSDYEEHNPEQHYIIGDDVYDYAFGQLPNAIHNSYKQNQILLNSDRITINSKFDSIFLSSHKLVNIGALQDIRFVTPTEIQLSAPNVFIGTGTKKEEEEVSSVGFEPLVMGTQLTEFLKEMIDVIAKAGFLCQGVPAGIIDATTTAPLKQELEALKNKLVETADNPIISDRHWIEMNQRDKENK